VAASFFRSIIDKIPRLSAHLFKHGCSILSSIVGLTCSPQRASPTEDILNGTISYPFYQTNPLGTNGPQEKFVIRSAVGNTEYTVEIPGGAKDYDVEVPLASLDSSATGGPDRPRNLPNPVVTDREMVNDLPSIEKQNPAGTAFMDKAFGVGKSNGPGQEPSYSLGLARIMQQYKAKQYEYTLIEINNMLAFYPNSPKLHKMKGTIYSKLRNFPLAEKSWIRALELDPQDRLLKESLLRLQNKSKSRTTTSNISPVSSEKLPNSEQ
jgi:hypothetical protein